MLEIYDYVGTMKVRIQVPRFMEFYWVKGMNVTYGTTIYWSGKQLDPGGAKRIPVIS